jgi:hypothetical protein
MKGFDAIKAKIEESYSKFPSKLFKQDFSCLRRGLWQRTSENWVSSIFVVEVMYMDERVHDHMPLYAFHGQKPESKFLFFVTQYRRWQKLRQLNWLSLLSSVRFIGVSKQFCYLCHLFGYDLEDYGTTEVCMWSEFYKHAPDRSAPSILVTASNPVELFTNEWPGGILVRRIIIRRKLRSQATSYWIRIGHPR